MLKEIVEGINEGWKFQKKNPGMSGVPTISIESSIKGHDGLVTLRHDSVNNLWLTNFTTDEEDLSKFSDKNFESIKPTQLEMVSDSLKKVIDATEKKFKVKMSPQKMVELLLATLDL